MPARCATATCERGLGAAGETAYCRSMLRCAVIGSLLVGSCAPSGPPDTPAAREAVAVCGAEATPAALAKNVPHLRFRSAFEAAGKVAVSPDMQALTRRYGQLDLAEHAAALRTAAAAAGVRECRLADELGKVATAEPSAGDCDALVKVLEAVGSVSPEYLEQIIAVGCSEIAGCARECVPGLSSFVEAPPDQHAQALARGCAAFRPQMSGGTAALHAFARARVAAFADACRPQLGGQAARVGELRRRVGL